MKDNEEDNKLEIIEGIKLTYGAFKIILQNILDLNSKTIVVSYKIDKKYLSKLLEKYGLTVSEIDEKDGSDIELFSTNDFLGVQINDVSKCQDIYLDHYLTEFFKINRFINKKLDEYSQDGKQEKYDSLERVLNRRLVQLQQYEEM